MVAKLDANLAALEVLGHCVDRWATADEQAVLARWSGWGAVPQVFDETDERYAAKRDELRLLLGTDAAWDQARRTTLNAHYTSAEVVGEMWRVAGALGFTSGRVLEPGCGSGTFLGLAPDGSELVGVELDSTTAAIAEQLYGARAHIHVGGFEEFAEPDSSFDLVIGNVPFGKVAPYDPRHNRSGHSLHNYFLIKSLRLAHPGGLVVALTSRYTLDARSQTARREMARLADLVGAVRLPAGTFAASSGTQVVTDLLVFRRRDGGAPAEEPEWVATTPLALPDLTPEVRAALEANGPPLVNRYFAGHHELVLGRLALARGMYREHELTVESSGAELRGQLSDALDRIAADAGNRGLTYAGRSDPAAGKATRRAATTRDFATHHAQEGSLVTGPNDMVGRYLAGEVVPYEPPQSKDLWELRRVIGLRDAARNVLAVQLGGRSADELRDVQGRLTERYESYRRIYGPLNRFRMVRTGHRDPDTGALVRRRDFPQMGGFRNLDPDWPLVAALEVFDDESQTARMSAIFTEQVVARPDSRHRVDSAADAVAVCLDETGAITTDRVADLLGIPEPQARDQLNDLLFEDPGTRDLVPAATYLSGNIRHKLQVARVAAAAADDDRWQANVIALEQVLPAQLEPAQITAQLGATWVPPGDIESFSNDVLGATIDVQLFADLGRWELKLRAGIRRSVALSSQWGTKRANALNLLDASLNQRLYTVYDTLPDKRRRRNDAETLAARDKQDALANRFAEWVWEDPARAGRLAGTYNELFRSVVLTRHDGEHLSLPGLAATFTPRRHQRDAVARILTDGRALLGHAVGAGKTATMVMAAMELRRIGSAAKPAVIVPNHMLEQFSREWLQLYPTARILIADTAQLDQARRKELVARCATGDWDGIVFTHSGFEHLPLGRELLAAYLHKEVTAARNAVLAAKKGKGLSVKKLEAITAQAEQTYKKLLAEHAKDDGVTWEETGIDYLFVDEAHLFKNRRLVTSIDGVATKGSRRAQDLDAKLWALRRRHGPRTVTFATATPVSNSMAELWVMQTYLQPDVLEGAGVQVFDSWAATFGRTHTDLELAPDGASYRMKARFARFQNVPELLGLYHQVADIRTAEDLGLPTPDIAGGKPEAVVVAPSETLRLYVADLAQRAEAIKNRTVDPKDDNMLAVTGDGRRAALDLRLVGLEPDHDGGKIAAAAQRVARIYETNRTCTYLDPQGQPSPRPGGLQLVFCDVSTPAADGWNAYDDLRDRLIDEGVPAEQISYMQDAKTHQAKAKLFAACRDGRVAVLVGSTETMGVGTNIQARAIALHHLDAPWRPADIEQRDGRIVRQGNQNTTVEIVRYVTEGSFDTYMWQTLQRKAEFIHQVASGSLTGREIDNIGEQVLSFAEVKALATGDPRIMEKAGVDADVARLTRLERAHSDDQQLLHLKLDAARERAQRAGSQADRLADVAERVTDTRGDLFEMVVDGQTHTKRVEAGKHLRVVLSHRLAATPPEATGDVGPIGQLAGLEVLGQAITAIEHEIRIHVPDADIELRFTGAEWGDADPVGLVQRLEGRIQRLATTVSQLREEAAAATDEAGQAETQLARPWEHGERLSRLRRRQQELDEALTQAFAPPGPDDDVPVAPGPSGLAGDVDRFRQHLDRPRVDSVDVGLER